MAGGAGEAYVVFGKQDNFGDDVRVTLSNGDTVVRRVIDLERLAPEDGFIIQGNTNDDREVVIVSGAGDVNGDGFADLIVGAPRATVNTRDDFRPDIGAAYLLFGKASGFGSLDTDTNRRVIELTSFGGGFVILGDEDRENAGSSVSGAGDVNGDGFADLIVGAPRGDLNTRRDDNTGLAYLVFGKASNSGRVIDLNRFNDEDGFVIRGDEDDDRAGSSVSAAGDVNGDGYADLIVGAYRGDDGGTNAGEAYVLFGGPAGLSTEAVAVLGTDGNDDLNANGGATVVLAGAGNDVLNIDGFGETDLLSFDGGTGTDTLRLNGAGLSLDLSTLPDTRLSSIERIDLSGSGANSLTLTRLDLLNLSEVRTQGIDGTEASRAELRVDGGRRRPRQHHRRLDGAARQRRDRWQTCIGPSTTAMPACWSIPPWT